MKSKHGDFLTGAVAMVAIFLGGCFCGAGPGQTEASLYLTDGTSGGPIAGASFTEGGQPLNAYCQEMDATDASRCISERLVLSGGPHDIAVSAPGYVGETVHVDTTTHDSVHLAVALKAAQ